MSNALKAAILGAEDLPREEVPTPEWPGLKVFARGLRATERDAWEVALFVGDGDERRVDKDNLRARLCVLCMVDESGERIFEDGDAEALGKKSAAVLDRIFDVAQRLSGMGAVAKESAAKN